MWWGKSEAVMRWHGDAVARWRGDAVVGGKANDWLVWWQGARQMTDWLGGRGQGKWLTNVVTQWHGDAVMQWRSGMVTQWHSDAVTRWRGDAVVGGKANDWLVWWQGARQMTAWLGGRGQGKWLIGDAVTRWCSDAVMQWCDWLWWVQLTNQNCAC